ncbi:uncharacterized protein LOC131951386 [Physella acuta]|uniref:uncharacterized protein LOC131951386 n=1 Tax=Physella acuta TaxID=109671 RepID=UPI0027DCB29E|nr:uncharacterized protein LOC131951386 [Physella acuta]XP_059169761.1 uncharacterized protein LOC131951386 [Physella acuta]XP_059169762.1 uncharacterized protein LOC131951386 [Physella acuta]
MSQSSSNESTVSSSLSAMSSKERGNVAIRMGKLYSTLPHCLRRLPENMPRNRQEFMIRKCMNPTELEVYFDDSNRYLYEARSLAQQMEDIKEERRKLLEQYKEQTKQLRDLIDERPLKPTMDLESMRKRFDKAIMDHAKAEARKQSSSTQSSYTRF